MRLLRYCYNNKIYVTIARACVAVSVCDVIYYARVNRNKLDPQHQENKHKPENKYHIIIFVYRLTRTTHRARPVHNAPECVSCALYTS